MRTFVMLAALSLAGCVSTQEVMNSAPVEVIESAKSVEAVVFCLQNKTGVAPADLDGAKVLLVKGVYGELNATYSVRPRGTGSVTEIRRGTTIAVREWKDCY